MNLMSVKNMYRGETLQQYDNDCNFLKEAKMIIMVETRWHIQHDRFSRRIVTFSFLNKIVRMEFLRTLSALV